MIIKLVTDGRRRTIMEIDGHVVGGNVVATKFRHDCRGGSAGGPRLKLYLIDGRVWDSTDGYPCPIQDHDDKGRTFDEWVKHIEQTETCERGGTIT